MGTALDSWPLLRLLFHLIYAGIFVPIIAWRLHLAAQEILNNPQPKSSAPPLRSPATTPSPGPTSRSLLRIYSLSTAVFAGLWAFSLPLYALGAAADHFGPPTDFPWHNYAGTYEALAIIASFYFAYLCALLAVLLIATKLTTNVVRLAMGGCSAGR